jgi:ferritin-like metal-binding protein YciE
MNRTHQVLTTYVSDTLALERCIFEAMDRQAGDAKLRAHPELHQLVDRARRILQLHLNALDEHLKMLGGKSTASVKETLTMIAGMAAGMIDKIRVNPVSKMLRDDYAALSFAAISYTMLHTTGLALKHEGTAELARKHLQDITPLIVEISQRIPEIVISELSEDTYSVDATAAEEARRNSQQAWSRDNVQPETANVGV